MPLYEYRCPECTTVFEVRRPMAASSEPASCPDGHPGAVRLLSVFAAVSGGGGGPSGASAMGAPATGMGCGGACACHPG